MISKKKVSAVIKNTSELAPGIFEMLLQTELAQGVVPGQFVAVYTKDASKLLPRPISICEVNEKTQIMRLVYRVAGEGTREFSSYRAGDQVELLGVLGNGYDIAFGKGKEVLLIGGGIGIPPLLELAKELDASKINIALGYRDSRFFLKEDFEKYGNVIIATEDGSFGTKGNVLDALQDHKIADKLNVDLIYSCGPMPMLRAVKRYARVKKVPAYLSMEERMACGVGACLGCVCVTTHKDHHSNVYNARICTDGPVFLADDVAILPEDQGKEDRV